MFISLNQSIMNKAHPIGTVYQNVADNTNPYTLFGVGTWQRVTGKYLRAMTDPEGSGATALNPKMGGTNSINIDWQHNHGNTNNISGAPNTNYTSTPKNSGADYPNVSTIGNHAHSVRLGWAIPSSGYRIRTTTALELGAVSGSYTGSTVVVDNPLSNVSGDSGSHTHSMPHDHLMTHYHTTNNAGTQTSSVKTIEPEWVGTYSWIRVL